MDVIYSWSKGASFRDICLMTGVKGVNGVNSVPWAADGPVR